MAQNAYASARQGEFFGKDTWKDLWLQRLEDTLDDNDEVRRCPETKVQKAVTTGRVDETWFWGKFSKDERVVFLHTGGSVALFGYDSAFDFSGRWTGDSAS